MNDVISLIGAIDGLQIKQALNKQVLELLNKEEQDCTDEEKALKRSLLLVSVAGAVKL